MSMKLSEKYWWFIAEAVGHGNYVSEKIRALKFEKELYK